MRTRTIASNALLVLCTGCASIAGLDLSGLHGQNAKAGGSGGTGAVDAGGAGGTIGTGGVGGGGPSGGSGGAAGTSASGGSDAGATGGSAGSIGAGGSSGSGGSGGTCNLSHLVISQVRTRGLAGASDEFVELYNPTPNHVTLDTSWTLVWRSATGSSFTTLWTGPGVMKIPLHGHYLIVGSGYAQNPTADASLSAGIADSGVLQLRDGTSVVDTICFYCDTTSKSQLFGNSDCEGNPLWNSAPGKNCGDDIDMALERRPGGSGGNCQDTGDNSGDFNAITPSDPHDTQSPPVP